MKTHTALEGAVVVTGGSRGIGAAVARLLCSRKIPVCINFSKSEQEANELVRELTKAGGQVCAVQADMSEEADIVRLFKETEDRLGFISGLVNNAGFTGQAGRRLAQADAKILQKSFAVNSIAPMLCARELIARSATSNGGKGGRIVNVSSIAGRTGSANDWVDYAASKAALNITTVGLAKEIGFDGIQVNGVAPGVINTDIHRLAGKPERVDAMTKLIPQRRAGLAVEVAEVIVWLLLDAPEYVHGTTIEVSGGL